MTPEIVLGSEKRFISGDYERWLREQIRSRRDAHAPVEVVVDIRGDFDLRFSCADQPQSGGGGRRRQYSPRQQEVIDLWFQCELDKAPIDLENLLLFLRRLKLLV